MTSIAFSVSGALVENAIALIVVLARLWAHLWLAEYAAICVVVTRCRWRSPPVQNFMPGSAPYKSGFAPAHGEVDG